MRSPRPQKARDRRLLDLPLRENRERSFASCGQAAGGPVIALNPMIAKILGGSQFEAQPLVRWEQFEDRVCRRRLAPSLIARTARASVGAEAASAGRIFAAMAWPGAEGRLRGGDAEIEECRGQRRRRYGMRKCNWRRLRSSRGERGCDLRSRRGRFRAKGLKINRDLNVLLVCGGDKDPIDHYRCRAGRLRSARTLPGSIR